MNKDLHIAIYGNPFASHETMDRMADLIRELQTTTFAALDIVSDFHAALLKLHVPLPEMNVVEHPHEDTDVIVSVGGDGTFLRAVAWEGRGVIPIAGLNGGHLGYLTGWTMDELRVFVNDIASRNYRVEPRALIKVEGIPTGADSDRYALNEVAVLKESSATMISVKAFIDGDYLADYAADGLIVSTPTGSTGYNLSVGGPILEPALAAWVISPVAAHSLNMRPLVVSDESEIELKANSRTGHLLLSLDGRSVRISQENTLRIVKAGFNALVARKTDATFAETLRKKLYWGLTGNGLS